MPARRILVVALLLMLVLAGCRSARINVRGSGAVVADPRPVGSFTRVTFAIPATLIVQPGDTDSVVVEADDNVSAEIRTEVLNGDLIIASQRSYITPRPSVPVTVRVTGKAIDTVNVTGVGEARVSGLNGPSLKLTLGGPARLTADNLRVDTLAVSLGGTGAMTISGQAPRQEATIGGATTYQADGLDSRDATVTASDGARAIVRASDSLNATVANGATIEYLGSPRVTERIIGSGQVRPYAP
ncbi:MAG: DUF2807 domain-containing protein [Anaerolineae bacterium]|nr:DUF2807 domain-containing protein [Anaerolineae bacterium]